jgi:protein ImuA
MAAANAREVIDALRDQIRSLEGRPPPRASYVPSGWEAVDAVLPGRGFPRGALSELCGGRASGKTVVALATLASATSARGLAAFVDGRHELYPPAAAALGLDLDRLLVVRPARAPGQARVALWAAEALLASGAFEAVAIDLPMDELIAGGGHGRASADAMLRRLRAAAEKGGAVALWLGSPDGVRVPSAVRLELASSPAGFQVRRAFPGAARGGDACAAVVAVHHAA